MTEHSNSIPELIKDFNDVLIMQPFKALEKGKILIKIINNLNDRILALEKEQLMKPDGKNK